MSDTQLHLGAVAQAAVGQFGGPPGGAKGKIVLFHQHGGKPPGDDIQGQPHPGDAAANNHHVNGILTGDQGIELALAPQRVKRGG